MAHTATTEMYLLGTYWRVEIDFSYDPPEPDVGLSETIYIDQVWLLGYYPEKAGGSDYVPCHIKCDMQCMNKEDIESLEEACHEFIETAAREAFDDSHDYEE